MTGLAFLGLDGEPVCVCGLVGEVKDCGLGGEGGAAGRRIAGRDFRASGGFEAGATGARTVCAGGYRECWVLVPWTGALTGVACARLEEFKAVNVDGGSEGEDVGVSENKTTCRCTAMWELRAGE